MARKRYKSAEPEEINMTPMIDVVFQMIIFFVTTVQLEKQAIDQSIVLAASPHGPAIERKVPGTVTVDIDRKGRIEIARVPLSLARFRSVIRKTVSLYGHQVPVAIRADGLTRHEAVRKVMDECKAAGIWKVSFVAIKEKAEAGKHGS